ncbi:hypothetical protein I79_009190 [Cricetulus griseus]|uniref:Peptidase S1 domain-containing protein n=1 Tax=Cricetulus griseus TaxID=10029 RepID=G3HF37_CRIGR|nr:hypothetical protein I79_009190 [Cricetulus griseus]
MEVHQSLLLLLALDTLWAAGNTSETHIIGGREAAPHSRPYMASLQKAGSHVCGGVLVHPKWVLTAAHCLPESLQQLKLVLGLHHLQDLRDPGLTFHIKAAIKHPGYNRNLENDLALLKGDSGGPLVCGKGQVDGILSFSSKNCTDIFKPPVATAVAPYSPWIRKVIHR